MIVLDTNVLSELMRPGASLSVIRWLRNQSEAELFTTAISEGEVFYGIELLPKGKRREILLSVAEAVFGDELGGRVLPFDSAAARSFSKIATSRRAMGNPIGQADAQIAAIVQANHATLATRNISDFESCGIHLIDPWTQ
jgi:toxin FitB